MPGIKPIFLLAYVVIVETMHSCLYCFSVCMYVQADVPAVASDAVQPGARGSVLSPAGVPACRQPQVSGVRGYDLERSLGWS